MYVPPIYGPSVRPGNRRLGHIRGGGWEGSGHCARHLLLDNIFFQHSAYSMIVERNKVYVNAEIGLKNDGGLRGVGREGGGGRCEGVSVYVCVSDRDRAEKQEYNESEIMV